METFLCLVIAMSVLRKYGDFRGRKLWVAAAGAAVVVALCFAIEPEARAMLMLVDYFGIDLMATVVIFYLRQHIVIAAALLFIPLLRLAYRWGPVPGFWPHRQVICSSWSWAGYAVIYPACAAAIGAVFLACLIRPWVV
jgi:hypothetical protein